MIRILLRVLLSCALLFSAACRGDNSVLAEVVGYNHTDKHIGRFAVDGVGGTGILAHKGGGKFTCCIGVPKPWRPGMTATIGWTDDHDEHYQERVVPVPKYDEVSRFAVHFLRNGEIKVFVTTYGLGHPDYPLKGTEAGLRLGEDPVEVWKRARGE